MVVSVIFVMLEDRFHYYLTIVHRFLYMVFANLLTIVQYILDYDCSVLVKHQLFLPELEFLHNLQLLLHVAVVLWVTDSIYQY